MRQPLGLQNIREMTLWGCLKLKSLFSISIATTIMLETLCIEECEELKHIITNEVEDDGLLNSTSIFPKLQSLKIEICNKLEFIFPCTLFGGLQKLKSIHIDGAEELEYVFGRYDDEECVSNENENNQPQIHLPALETLSVHDVPKMINICAKKYYLSFLSLQNFELEDLQEFNEYQGTNHIQKGTENGDSENQAATNALPDFAESSKDAMKRSAEEVVSSMSKEEIVKEIEAKDLTLALEEQAPKASIADEPQLRRSPLQNNKETEKADGKVAPDPASKLLATTSSASQTYKGKEKEVGKGIVASRSPATTSLNFESGIQNIPEATTPMKSKTNTSSIHLQSDPPAQVANMKETDEQVSQEDDATKEATIAFQLTDSQSQKQTRRLEETEKEAVRTHPSQLSMASTLTNSKSSIKINPEDSTPTIVELSISPVHSQAEDSHSDPPAQSSKEAMKTSVEEVVSSMVPTSKEERVREIEAKDVTLALEEQAPKGPTTESQLKTPLHSTRNIQEHTTAKKAKTDTFLIYSHAEGSQSGPSTMTVESFQEETATMEAKIDTSSSCSQGEDSQLGPSTTVGSMEEIVKHDFQKHDSPNDDPIAIQFANQVLINQPRGSLHMPLGKEFAETAKKTRDTNVQDGPKSDKAEMANLLTNSCDIKPNIPMEDSTNLPNVIPSSHHQSQTGAAGCSPTLEIGEIFQLVELKDGEPALLAKALELYPQLRLSHGQRTHPIISFSYRVLVDILFMLAIKTPYTITASDRTTLEDNLGAATFLGFDKDWIELVRAKVFAIDRSDVLVAEERISVMEEELEKCDKALECMQKNRMEAKEKLAMVQNEFDAVDTQLFDLLENRRSLVMKMNEFRKITSAKDKPFGI